MSTATRVPETWELSGDDARKALSDAGRARLLRDAFSRLRSADGFSHSRSLAFVISLVLVQGLIVIVGLSHALGSWGLSRAIVDAIEAAAPGPTKQVLTDAVAQADRVGNSHRYLPLILGLIGTVVTATTAFGQLERGFNRIYGIEKDRSTVRKYGRALVLALTTGVVFALAFTMLALGRGLDQGGNGDVHVLWQIIRWPLGLLLAAAALGTILRFAPYRRQPGRTWLAFAGAVCAGLWSLVTLLLGALFALSSTFGDTYGALAGIVALQLWSLLSAVAIFYGAAVAAQLEFVRAEAQAPSQLRSDPNGHSARRTTALEAGSGVVDSALQRARHPGPAPRDAGKLDETVRQG